MQQQDIKRVLLIIARIVLGIVFIFSSFVKGIDPLGSAYKFSDYFIAFGMEFLEFLALPLSFVLSATEFLIGISLLLNLKFRLGAWGVMVFMVFFTLLTFILALTNPVSDCGCFGDAVIMTNWQTFFKNLILMPFVLIVFWLRKDRPGLLTGIYQCTGLLVWFICFLAMEIHVYRHLPLLDFRPYSVGTSIPEKMRIPEGAEPDVFETMLVYERDGEVREFTEENFPWQDTTWKYVDSRHRLVSKGYEPPIHDFTISDENGVDITHEVLADPGYSFLVVSTHLDKGDPESLRYADELSTYCNASGHAFYCLTASGDATIQQVRQDLELGFGIYTTDEITLKTIVRANPGLLLLKEGIILAKWHYNDFPPPGDITTATLAEVLLAGRRTLEGCSGLIAVLVACLVTLILFLVFPRKP